MPSTVSGASPAPLPGVQILIRPNTDLLLSRLGERRSGGTDRRSPSLASCSAWWRPTVTTTSSRRSPTPGDWHPVAVFVTPRSTIWHLRAVLLGDDEGMSARNKWWGWLAAVPAAFVLSVFVPVAAWASTGTGERVAEAARRPRGGAGLLCCLVVIAVVLLLVLWLVRRRRGRPR
jgi:hypothetical protein